MNDFAAPPHSQLSDPPPSGGPPFRVVYADPPWRLQGGVRLPYPTMPARAIRALPVTDICAEDCALFLWATHGTLPDALRVVAAWGFAYRTVAFTWVKANRTRPGFYAGQGGWTRANPEVCLLGTRGCPKRVSTSVPNLVVSARREHSRKPDEVRERIVSLLGDVPRAEMFARQKVPGWAAWGNEVECDFDLPATEVLAESRSRSRAAGSMWLSAIVSSFASQQPGCRAFQRLGQSQNLQVGYQTAAVLDAGDVLPGRDLPTLRQSGQPGAQLVLLDRQGQAVLPYVRVYLIELDNARSHCGMHECVASPVR